MLALFVCSAIASCGGGAVAKVEFPEGKNVDLNDEDGIDQSSLNEIAEFIANNKAAYEGIVAAYRGYDITKEDGSKDEYPAIKNEDGTPAVNLEGALAILKKCDDEDSSVALKIDKLDEQDVINLVEFWKEENKVEIEVERNFFDNLQYWIGTALGFITNTVGFGNYIVGICIFAIILEILLLPLGIKRQKNSIKQASLRPKEMAIRKKYAGRNDQVTQQKIQQEIQQLYQKENFNPASGCLPLLIQLPSVFVLYNIVVDPLRYGLGKSVEFSSAIQTFFSTSKVAGGLGGTLSASRNGTIGVLAQLKGQNLEGLKTFEYFSNGEAVFNEISSITIPSFNIGNVNFGGTPVLTEFSWLLIVPILTFVVYFASSKLTRKLTYQPTAGADAQAMGCSNNIMDFMMPAFSVYFTFMVPAAVGIYWMFKSVLSTLQQFILYKVMPLPTFTEEDYKAAEKELAGKSNKNRNNTERAPRDPNAPRVRSLHHIDDEDYDENGVYKPVVKEEKVEAEASTAEKSAAIPEGAVPLKDDAPKHEKKKKDKKSNKDDSAASDAEKSEEEATEDSETK